jgi:hypothetical protein
VIRRAHSSRSWVRPCLRCATNSRSSAAVLSAVIGGGVDAPERSVFAICCHPFHQLPWIVDRCRKKASPPFSRSGHRVLTDPAGCDALSKWTAKPGLFPVAFPFRPWTSAVFSLTPLDSTVTLDLLCFTVYKKTAHAYHSTSPCSSFGSSGSFQAYRKYRLYRTRWSRCADRPGNRGRSPELRFIHFTHAHKNGNFANTLGPRNGLLCATLIRRNGLHCACEFCTHAHTPPAPHHIDLLGVYQRRKPKRG